VGTEYPDGKEQSATAGDRAYAITHVGDKAYTACVAHNRGDSTAQPAA
jgi:hypothetical protein